MKNQARLWMVWAACGMLALTVFAAANAVARPAAGEPVLINGAGATFPYPVYSKWFDEYHKMHPEIQINYQSIGSGGGIRQVTEGTVDFGATDGPMSDEQLAAYREKHGHGILHFPTVLGAVVPTYNLPGVDAGLRFTAETLADIFLGRITRWNDPALTRANPGVKLPSANIIVVHRSDGSGTTYIWTDYLSKVSPAWKERVGKGTSVNWPVGLGGKGNEGVAGLVKQTPGAFGYVELIYAVHNNLGYGSVENAAGKFIRASLQTVTAAAAGAAREIPEDFRVSITNASGASSYPIASFTWLLVPANISDPVKKKALMDFLQWMVGPGQKLAEPLEYAPLPDEVVTMERRTFSRIH